MGSCCVFAKCWRNSPLSADAPPRRYCSRQHVADRMICLDSADKNLPPVPDGQAFRNGKEGGQRLHGVRTKMETNRIRTTPGSSISF
jgi:hypothetical protein